MAHILKELDGKDWGGSRLNIGQRTLKREVGCTGIGLHSGKEVSIKIRPAPSNFGICFVREDIDPSFYIKADFKNVIDTKLSTTIGSNGCKVGTIEHLMAAFYGLGIDNAIVYVNGPELPAMDGSSAPYVLMLKEAGIKEQEEPKRFIVIKKGIKAKDGDRSVEIRPCKELRILYEIEFDHPLIRRQRLEFHFSGNDFIQEISRARTFGFLSEVEEMWKNGLARGGSLDNAVVIDEFRILNEDGLRYRDEFVRHKILDFIGDLALIGAPIIGRFIVKKSGHYLNQQMLKRLMNNRRCWKYLELNNLKEIKRGIVEIPSIGKLEPSYI